MKEKRHLLSIPPGRAVPFLSVKMINLEEHGLFPMEHVLACLPVCLCLCVIVFIEQCSFKYSALFQIEVLGKCSADPHS